VPRAYEEKGAYESQNEEKKGPTKTKNEGKGAYKVQTEGNRPLKFFALQNILKVPRAYESLNPGLSLLFEWFLIFSNLKSNEDRKSKKKF
jgi:hypothetical protein